MELKLKILRKLNRMLRIWRICFIAVINEFYARWIDFCIYLNVYFYFFYFSFFGCYTFTGFCYIIQLNKKNIWGHLQEWLKNQLKILNIAYIIWSS